MRLLSEKNYAGLAIAAAGLAFLLLYGNPESRAMKSLLPLFTAADAWGGYGSGGLLQESLAQLFPLYTYAGFGYGDAGQDTEEMTLEEILQAEGGEGELPQKELIPEQTWELLEAEQEAYLQAQLGEQSAAPGGQSLAARQEFIPHTQKLSQVDMAALADYETLTERFYTIDKSTMIGSDQLNASVLAALDLTITKQEQGPQILIYHTHSQEAFADSVQGDRATSIVGVGDRLAQILTEEYGYEVLHHDAAYDLPSRDDAYSVALPEIEKLLEENPQIQVVIDLHRDAVEESTRLVTKIDGRPTARFMFFNGLSRTRTTGNISYLYNENLDANLAFSFQMQKAAMEYYPGLTRKIYLKAYRYNMHLKPRTLLVELGAQNNTVEEAMNACDPLAHIIDIVLSGS